METDATSLICLSLFASYEFTSVVILFYDGIQS